MENPSKIVERIAQLLAQAREALGAGRLEQAEASARDAAVLDPRDARIEDVLAEILRASGNEGAAGLHEDAATRLRKEAWQREVEAEARGHHEWMGAAVRHEVPR